MQLGHEGVGMQGHGGYACSRDPQLGHLKERAHGQSTNYPPFGEFYKGLATKSRLGYYLFLFLPAQIYVKNSTKMNCII